MWLIYPTYRDLQTANRGQITVSANISDNFDLTPIFRFFKKMDKHQRVNITVIWCGGIR